MRALSAANLLIFICATSFTVANGQPPATTIATGSEVVFMARAAAVVDYEVLREAIINGDEQLVDRSGIVPDWREKQIASLSQAHKTLYRKAYRTKSWVLRLHLPSRKAVMWAGITVVVIGIF